MDVTQAFLSGAKNYSEFPEALDIVKKNTFGKIWLIGGFVYRTIASQLYGLPKPQVDLDFIVENTVPDFDLPQGWKAIKNSYGNPKFVNGKKQIDFIPIETIYSLVEQKLEPTIENFLAHAPLTVQSVVYAIDQQEIIGEIGIDALRRKVVAVNDLSVAKYSAEKKSKSLREMIQEKASSLGFTAICPY